VTGPATQPVLTYGIDEDNNTFQNMAELRHLQKLPEKRSGYSSSTQNADMP
jgi:hypothetical protein